MTATAQPRRAQPASEPDSEFKHGPVAAAFNASAGTLFLTTIGKIAGLPPWLALLTGLIMAGCLAWAGKHRRPRPLSRATMLYRGLVALTAAGWMWWQMATFPTGGVALSSTVTVAWAVTAVAVLAAAVTRRLPGPVRFAVAAFTVAFTLALTAVLGRPVFSWLHSVLFVTDRMPFGDLRIILTWLGYSALSLAIIAAPLAVLGTVFANRERSADEELSAAQQPARRIPAEGRRMQKLVCDLTSEWTTRRFDDAARTEVKIPNLRVTEVKFWDNGGGESYIFDLTGTDRGTTVTGLRSITTDVATKLNLPEGCGAEVLPVPELGRGFASLDVARVNKLKEKIFYPALEQRSILNPLPIGVTRAGKKIGPYLRSSSVFLWGQKDSGKTGTIFDLVAGGLQCTDTLVWVIDLNGGAAAAPFLTGWYEGKVDRPCIDWVATTIEEVREMGQVGLDIALDRKVFYRPLKKLHNTNLMPVGNGEPGQPPPAVLIVIDEGKTVMGGNGTQLSEEDKEARAALLDIMDLARDAAFTIVFSGLRATAEVADSGFKAGTAIRIGMRVTDPAELAYGFGDYSLDPAEIPEQGSGFITVGHEEPGIQVFKAYYLDPDRNEQIGIETTPWRPYMDERGVQVGGGRYANRWRRTAHHIWPDPRPEMVMYGAGPLRAGAAASITAAPRSSSSVNVAAGTSLPKGDSFDDVIAHAKRQQAAARRDPDADPDGDQADPAGPPPAPVPAAAGPPGPALPVIDGETEAQQEYDRRFADMATHMTVLPGDPDRPLPPIPVPPAGEIAANPHSRVILEQLIKLRGPLTWTDLCQMLAAGGDWGPAVPIRPQAISKLLKQPGSKDREPVEWLVERQPGDPYDHKARAGRPPSGSADTA